MIKNDFNEKNLCVKFKMRTKPEQTADFFVNRGCRVDSGLKVNREFPRASRRLPANRGFSRANRRCRANSKFPRANRRLKVNRGFSCAIRKFSATVLIFLLTIFGISCQHENIFDYLNENSKKIEVSKMTANLDLPVDKDGYLSLPSNQDVILNYQIKNPSGYELTYTYNVPSTTQTVIENLLASSAIYSETNYSTEMSDNFVVIASFSQDFLYQLERSQLENAGPGIDFSATLNLSSKDYVYNGSSQIEPYTKNIRVNSPPPCVQGGAIMVDSGTSTDKSLGCYVLCFNLPPSIFENNGIHRDVTQIKIEGLSNGVDYISPSKRYSNGIDLNINFSGEAISYNTVDLPNKASSTLKLSRIEYNNVGAYGFPAVEFEAGTYPVFIADENAFSSSGDSRTYTITLYDSKGLSSSVKLNTLFHQLELVKAKTHKTYYEQGSFNISLTDQEVAQGYLFFNLEAPIGVVGGTLFDVKDAEIYYSIYSLDILRVLFSSETKSSTEDASWIQNSNVRFEEKHSNSPVVLKLNDNTIYKIDAFARKDGYLDSNLATWIVNVGNWRFVDVSINGISYNAKFDLVTKSVDEDKFPKSYEFTVSFYDENGKFLEPDWTSAPYSLLEKMILQIKDKSGGTVIDTVEKDISSSAEGEKTNSIIYTLDSLWKTEAQNSGGSVPIYFELEAQIAGNSAKESWEFNLEI